jgi:phenylacetate-CoA ligase
MIIVRGVNVSPSQIETVLLQVGQVAPHYQIIVDRGADHLDELDVLVEAPAELFADRGGLAVHETRLRHEVQSVLGISCNVTLVAPREIQRSEGKATRVVDKRRL